MTSERKRKVLAAVGALAIGAATGRLLLDSMNDPDPALLDVLSAHADPAEPVPSRAAASEHLPDHLVLVVLDGLGEEVFAEVAKPTNLGHPAWKAVVDVGTPSLSRPVYHVLLTGIPQDVSGIRNNAHKGRARADDLTSQVRARGGQVAFALEGVPWFLELFAEPEDLSEHVWIQPLVDRFTDLWEGTPRLGDDRTGTMARMVDAGLDLTILHYTAIDHAGHDHGGRSAPYRHEAESAVGSAMEVRDAWARRPGGARTVWMFGSDHGHLPKGGHGGPELEVRRTAWYGYWPGPVPAPVDLPDPVPADRLAATFAAILGVPPPREALGDPLPLPDRPVTPSAAAAARRSAVTAALQESTHSAHHGVLARAAAVLLALVAFSIQKFRKNKLGPLAGAVLPTLLAGLAFCLLGPGMTLSAIRTQLGFLVHSTVTMSLGALLAYPFAKRLGATSTDMLLAAAAAPLSAVAITAASMGHSHLPDGLLLLFPATGLLPWAVLFATSFAWLIGSRSEGDLHKRRNAGG